MHRDSWALPDRGPGSERDVPTTRSRTRQIKMRRIPKIIRPYPFMNLAKVNKASSGMHQGRKAAHETHHPVRCTRLMKSVLRNQGSSEAFSAPKVLQYVSPYGHHRFSTEIQSDRMGNAEDSAWLQRSQRNTCSTPLGTR